MITRILANLFTFPYKDSGCDTEAPPPRKEKSLSDDGWWVSKDGRVLPPAPPPRTKD